MINRCHEASSYKRDESVTILVQFSWPSGPHPDDFPLEGTAFLRLEKKPLELSKRLAVEVWQVERRITRGDERGGSRETRFRRRAAAGSIFLITDSRSTDLELPTQSALH